MTMVSLAEDRTKAHVAPYAVVTADRLIPAAPLAVWHAWTDPVAMKRWWGRSEGLELFRCEMDVRVGGRYRYAMRPLNDQNGPVEEVHGAYIEAVPGQRLVFTWIWDSGAVEGVSVDTLVTVTFSPEAGGTRVRVRHENQPSEEVAKIHEGGWTAMLADLDAHVRRT